MTATVVAAGMRPGDGGGGGSGGGSGCAWYGGTMAVVMVMAAAVAVVGTDGRRVSRFNEHDSKVLIRRISLMSAAVVGGGGGGERGRGRTVAVGRQPRGRLCAATSGSSGDGVLAGSKHGGDLAAGSTAQRFVDLL